MQKVQSNASSILTPMQCGSSSSFSEALQLFPNCPTPLPAPPPNVRMGFLVLLQSKYIKAFGLLEEEHLCQRPALWQKTRFPRIHVKTREKE